MLSPVIILKLKYDQNLTKVQWPKNRIPLSSTFSLFQNLILKNKWKIKVWIALSFANGTILNILSTHHPIVCFFVNARSPLTQTQTHIYISKNDCLYLWVWPRIQKKANRIIQNKLILFFSSFYESELIFPKFMLYKLVYSLGKYRYINSLREIWRLSMMEM